MNLELIFLLQIYVFVNLLSENSLLLENSIIEFYCTETAM